MSDAKMDGLLARLRAMRALRGAPPSDSEDDDAFAGRAPESNESYMTLPPNATRFDTHISMGSSRAPSSQPMSAGDSYSGRRPARNESYMTLPTNATRFDTLFSMDSSPPLSSQPADETTLWFDTRPTARPYVHESDDASTVSSYQPRSGQVRDTQISFKRRASGLGVPNSHGDMPYESAFRLIEHAADAERSADPLLATQLYAEAGELLARASKAEQDLLLKQSVREKAMELIKRAEELEKWYYSLQEHVRKASLPPQLQIQKTSIPRVQELWQGLRPPYWQQEEFTHMRYTAVTTKNPLRFTDDGFQLRVDELQRNIRTFIMVTVASEEGPKLSMTLQGIARNLQFMCELWGDKAWENVVVAVISDGRSETKSSCFDYLRGIGAFDEEVMAVTSVGVDVQMHLFETTVQFVREENSEAFFPPIQLMYALKEHKGGRLHSHTWLFSAFAEQLLPVYTVFVDAGTTPKPNAIFRLVRTMDRDHQIGAVAGEVSVNQPNYLNPVIAAQNFERKISSIMDKSLESVCGFVSVLPREFSAYRYEAIRPEKGNGPLLEYFRSLAASRRDLGPFKGNVCLVDDRILCFELLVSKGRNWTMNYVKDAIAQTDVPKTLVDLIKQRRLQFDSSFLGGLFVLSKIGRVWNESGHSRLRKGVLTVQFVFLFWQNVWNWFLLSNVFLTIYFVLTLMFYTDVRGLLQGVLGVYVALIIGTVVFALGNRTEKRTALFYFFGIIFFGVVMLAVICISIYGLLANLDVDDPREDLPSCHVSNLELTGIVSTTVGLIVLSALLHGDICLVLCTLQYVFMFPTYVNVLDVYSYSNLNESSGSYDNGLETPVVRTMAKSSTGGKLKEIVARQKFIESEKQRAITDEKDVDNSFRSFWSTLLLCWLVTNAAWVYSMTSYMSSSCYLLGLAYVVGIFTVVRFLGSVMFLVLRACRRLQRSPTDDSMYQHNHSPEWQSCYEGDSNHHSQSSSSQIKIDMAVLSPRTGFRELTL